MRLGWKIAWFAGCVMGATRGSAAPMTNPPILEYSQDGKTFFPFAAITGNAKATTYYDYHNSSGHPEFGTGRDISSVGFYWDNRHDLLSLIAITGTPGRGKGEVKFSFDGLPSSTVLALSDDPREFKYSAGKAHASGRFRFSRGTDGQVFGGLEQSASLAVELALTPVKRVNEWRLVNGDLSDGGSAIDLDMNKPLFLRTTEVAASPGHHHHHPTSTPPPAVVPPASGQSGGNSDGVSSGPSVPEPGFGLGILSGMGLLIFRVRR